MNKIKLKEILKKRIREVLLEEPKISPSKPEQEPDVMEPGTKEPVKPKRRTLTPPEHAPTERPAKAEQSLVDKITARFKQLSK